MPATAAAGCPPGEGTAMARAPINGATLAWARAAMRLEPEDIAKAAGTTLEKARGFESEEVEPTLRQLEKIAKKLDRTMAFFFTAPPAAVDVPDAPDFRGRGEEALPPLLAREMRRAEQYREVMLDLQGKPEHAVRAGSVSWETAQKRATELRTRLGLREDFVPQMSDMSKVLNFWRDLLERNGYLIFQTTRIPLSVFRGLSIHHDHLPVILLNGADSHAGKVFTIFHEIAHLANKTSGLCDLDRHVNEEAVANAFAANFLMPSGQVRGFVEECAEGGLGLARKMGKVFKVSLLAAGVRLRTLRFINDDELETLREESDAAWGEYRTAQKASPGGPPAWQLRYRDLGKPYIGAVAKAVEDDRADLLDASYLLNARIPMVEQMFEEYYRSEAG